MAKSTKSKKKPAYDCGKCPGYCCSYPLIIVKKRDIQRLAKRFELSFEDAERKFTRAVPEYGRVLRHRKDTIFDSVCRFFDRETRRCTVYEDRPGVCREYPITKRCGYFDFLQWERKQQDDKTFVPFSR